MNFLEEAQANFAVDREVMLPHLIGQMHVVARLVATDVDLLS